MLRSKLCSEKNIPNAQKRHSSHQCLLAFLGYACVKAARKKHWWNWRLEETLTIEDRHRILSSGNSISDPSAASQIQILRTRNVYEVKEEGINFITILRAASAPLDLLLGSISSTFYARIFRKKVVVQLFFWRQNFIQKMRL